MASDKASGLGHLTRVELREYWKDEARDFTPWLAEENNLALLSEVIGMELEFVGSERPVGGFKVDILAKDIDSGQFVVIENQLEKTNHAHLGQLLTYASGCKAKAVIWIAKEIGEEHRKAMDWLNEMTSDEVAFFGIEMELWKIGESPSAPNFKIISQPNDWARTVKLAASNDNELSPTKILQHQFWDEMIKHFRYKKTFLSMKKPRAQHWFTIAVGRTEFHLSLTVDSVQQRISCGLYIGGDSAKIAYGLLEKQKEEISAKLGKDKKIEWKKLPEQKASRIVEYREGNFKKKDTWPELFEWLRERAETFHKVLSPCIKELDIDSEDNV